jgi:hypothetical protein
MWRFWKVLTTFMDGGDWEALAELVRAVKA